MGHYRKGQCYRPVRQPRYLVVWSMFWDCLEFEPVPPLADLKLAMGGALSRLAALGWEAEGAADHGSVFMRRGNERRLLMLTPRHPHDASSQAFSPHRPAGAGR